jgi:hypothetical protein
VSIPDSSLPELAEAARQVNIGHFQKKALKTYTWFGGYLEDLRANMANIINI